MTDLDLVRRPVEGIVQGVTTEAFSATHVREISTCETAILFFET
jgi:hypothetical protein